MQVLLPDAEMGRGKREGLLICKCDWKSPETVSAEVSIASCSLSPPMFSVTACIVPIASYPY